MASVVVPLSRRMAYIGEEASGDDEAEEMIMEEGSGTF